MIETKIVSTLSPAFKIFPLVAPQGIRAPFLIYSVISETPSDVLCGQADVPTVIQLDSYSHDPITAKQYGQTALTQLSYLGLCNINCASSFEEETKLYRYQIEFMLIL